MIDPELAYRRIASGDVGAIRDRVDTLRGATRSLDAAGDGVFEATGVPVWTGRGATSFQLRSAAVLRGLRGGWVAASTVRGALETAASAYEGASGDADEVIATWRNRPEMPSVLESLWAVVINAQLNGIIDAYDTDLAAITSVLEGDGSELDLDELDDDTREWVEKGLDKTEDWLDETGSSNGPMIPNTLATGDDRGLTPQGLGYDKSSGMLLQTYYKKGEPAVLSIVDPTTGREVNEVVLGDGDVTETSPDIGHAGGVTVAGDQAIVSSGGKLYSYPVDALASGSSGAPVQPTAIDDVDVAASYTAFHDGKLYVGDYDENIMRVYERRDGAWVPPLSGPTTLETPDKTQGVIVRDDDIIYSTSPNRMTDSTMVVRDHDGNTMGEYDGFPNMSEGIVEIDGELVATYESGAAQYDHSSTGPAGWLWGVPDDDSLWASPFMTRTPLEEIGLDGELEAEPGSLRDAAAGLAEPTATLRRLAGTLDGVTLPSHVLGDVSAAGGLSAAVEALVEDAARSARTGSDASDRLADALETSGHHYQATDLNVRNLFDRLGLP